MTAHRRVAYGAEDDLAELAGIKADLMLAVGRMDKLIKRLDGDLCGNVEDAATMVQDDVVKGRLFLAEQALKKTVEREERWAESQHERDERWALRP